MIADRNVLKSYAPQARKDFIQAMSNRAARFGITRERIAPGQHQGQLFLVEGQAFPRQVGAQRAKLIARIEATSFDQTMEAAAYTWFNRFLAIRYIELHGYLDHGLRVLSHPRGETEPEILQQAQHLNLPGLSQDEVVALKLEGTKDDVLYRRILIAQCNHLHRAMPFLFERIDDETELLLPDNLLQTDSLIRKLVAAIPESDWAEIEIIGWLYQFYIAEKKDQVIGKVVKSEDIPAATQLFTPNWIVKYMVQNSVGAQWLATYPQSSLKAQMAYYIEPAEQTEEVRAQLAAITPRSVDPETITLIDPAVGSGHILVEAYDLFRAIYLERGYSPSEAARAILTRNLYGLDIDDRAAQMAGFALLMKARADDRTLLSDPPALHVMSLTDSGGWDAAAMADVLLPSGRIELLPTTDLLPQTLRQPTLSLSQGDRAARTAIADIVALFDGAKTFGSLITVPEKVNVALPLLEGLLVTGEEGDLLHRHARAAARDRLAALVNQAKLLGRSYDCVVANPPYMGSNYFGSKLKSFSTKFFKPYRNDLYSMFFERCGEFVRRYGIYSCIAFQNWMFLSSFEEIRGKILDLSPFKSLVHIGRGAFGSDFGTAVFASQVGLDPSYLAVFRRLFDRPGEVSGNETLSRRFLTTKSYLQSAQAFSGIPTRPIAYWTSPRVLQAFQTEVFIGERAKKGFSCSGTDKFYRYWYEISVAKFSRHSGKKWFPITKGGDFRKWYGNCELVVNWEDNGKEIRAQKDALGKPLAAIRNEDSYFKCGVSWNDVSIASFSCRATDRDFLPTDAGPMIYGDAMNDIIMCALNSNAAKPFLQILCPTVHFGVGQIARFPLANVDADGLALTASKLVLLTRRDWNRQETSWDFLASPLVENVAATANLSAAFSETRARWQEDVRETRDLEEANNNVFIQAYGLTDELNSEVPLSEITLTCNPHYRYGGDLTDGQREARLRSDTMRELISYAVGLTMGRYSLAEPGLVYADAGNLGFDPGRYGDFPADEDGIVPTTEEAWFGDDAATRTEEFLKLAWPVAPVGETLATLANGLTQGKGGDPREELRAYLSKSFYKDHLQTYRNRPIYWLFSSGKAKAFEALVYLHRYNESTLARMRTAYVAPLMGKMQQRVADLEVDIAGSASSAEKTRKGRDREKVIKQLVELRAFDEELRHLADQRIALDLDDGVKVNYGRFGNLLAAKDKVCGKDEDD